MLARQLYHQSSRVVAALAGALPALLQQDPGIRALLEGMVGYSRTVVYAAVVDPADRILAHSNPKLEGEILPPRESLERLKTRSTFAIVASLFGQPEVYEAAGADATGRAPLRHRRESASRPACSSRSWPRPRSIAWRSRWSLSVSPSRSGSSSAISCCQSLRKIAEGMERLARGEYGATVELTRDDELGELAARVQSAGRASAR